MKWENYMDKQDRDKRRLEYIWFRKCLSWKEAAQGADGWMGVGAQKFFLLLPEAVHPGKEHPLLQLHRAIPTHAVIFLTWAVSKKTTLHIFDLICSIYC